MSRSRDKTERADKAVRAEHTESSIRTDRTDRTERAAHPETTTDSHRILVALSLARHSSFCTGGRRTHKSVRKVKRGTC
eukprot:27110-Rhodomonas_salina.1